ncbi:DUF732 domain-containing protein [Mycobacterium sp. URHB0021]
MKLFTATLVALVLTTAAPSATARADTADTAYLRAVRDIGITDSTYTAEQNDAVITLGKTACTDLEGGSSRESVAGSLEIGVITELQALRWVAAAADAYCPTY